MQTKSNLEMHEDCVIVSVNPKVYTLDVVYSAAYVFLDRAYIILDGDPEKIVSVQLRPKKREDLETLGMEFNNELLNYAVYKSQVEKNFSVRQAIVERALLTNLRFPDEPKESEEKEIAWNETVKRKDDNK